MRRLVYKCFDRKNNLIKVVKTLTEAKEWKSLKRGNRVEESLETVFSLQNENGQSILKEQML